MYLDVTHRVPTPPAQEDRLEKVWSLQEELMRRYAVHPQQLRINPMGMTRASLSLKIAWCVVREMVEIMDEIGWKWWRSPKQPDKKRVHEEIIDLLHFVLELAVLWGMTPQTMYERYVEKNKINHDRIEQEFALAAQEEQE